LVFVQLRIAQIGLARPRGLVRPRGLRPQDEASRPRGLEAWGLNEASRPQPGLRRPQKASCRPRGLRPEIQASGSRGLAGLRPGLRPGGLMRPQRGLARPRQASNRPRRLRSLRSLEPRLRRLEGFARLEAWRGFASLREPCRLAKARKKPQTAAGFKIRSLMANRSLEQQASKQASSANLSLYGRFSLKNKCL
jgi:hypothetical protein